MMNSATIILLSILFFFNIPSQLLKAIDAPALAMAIPTGQSAPQASQLHALSAFIKSNGYRKRRNNAYGDEIISPTAGLTIPMPLPIEQAPAKADQSYGSAVPAQVEASGYRKKRNNAYGDEVIPPTTNLEVSMEVPVEQAPAKADQFYGSAVPALVEASGYRKKRNNAYGDEAIPPTTGLAVSMATPAEQPLTQADQSYAVAATVVPSGY